jgi:predicted dehydrogenase
MTEEVKIGFIGAGGIAKAHIYALQALKFYYQEVPEIKLISVTSAKEASRSSFAEKYGFTKAESLEDFLGNAEINTVFILGPNSTHFEHFREALKMKNVHRIYLEKPVCSTQQEEEEMARLSSLTEKKIQVGFQYLLTPSVRQAFILWKSGILGNPVHFDLKYYHGDYLQKSYRDKRKTRLTPAPDGGAMADLGCHGISLLTAFLGKGLKLTGAMQAGHFEGVPAESDLFSTISLVDPKTRAAGHLSASRISSGSGDLVDLEIYAEKGTLRYSSQNPDYFEYYAEAEGSWRRQPVGSNYSRITSFPSGHVPAGWLRSMVHAHYNFLGGTDQMAFIPDLDHGLEVQRLVRETSVFLDNFRNTFHDE